jgi:succinoglycan biosynthesis protein ExoA
MTGASTLQWAIAAARRSPLGHHPDSFIYSDKAQFSPASSVAVAYRKSVFEKVGNFDESFDAAEDVEFNTRIDAAGLKCFFEPSIAVHYVPRKTLNGLFVQMERYGRGRVRLWRKYRHTFSWKSFAPGMFVFGIPFAFLSHCAYSFSFADRLNQILFLCKSLMELIYMFYLAAVVIESVRLTTRQNFWNIVFLPAVFFTIHVGYGWGILREFFFPRNLSVT